MAVQVIDALSPELAQAEHKAWDAAWDATPGDDYGEAKAAADTAVETVWFAYWTRHVVSAHSSLPGAYYT